MRFEGKRRPRGATKIGLLAVVAVGVVIASLIATRGAAALAWVPYLAIAGVLALMASVVVAAVARDATLDIDGPSLRPSWRPELTIEQPPTMGRLVMAGLDTPVGVVVHLGNARERITVGCTGHAGSGFATSGDPVRTADFELGRADFARFLELAAPARVDRDHLAIGLVPSSQTTAGILRMMGPWLLTIAAASAFGLVVGLTGLDEQLMQRRYGMYVIGGITMGIVLGGLTWTIVHNSRIKKPRRELRLDPGGMIAMRIDTREPVELARAGWSAITAEPRRFVVRGRGSTTTLPALVLTIGELELVVATWDSTHAWSHEVAKARRSPPWLIGGPEWPLLIAALHAHGRLA
ncbi:MAG: hypothetical protein K8W52_06885 [Deltaproteobacteria bacterium]|nr:hypothetical protein [Deltaproteobacteria bacterium]